ERPLVTVSTVTGTPTSSPTSKIKPIAAARAPSTLDVSVPPIAKNAIATTNSTTRSITMASARDGNVASRISRATASPVTRSLTLVSLPAVDLDAFVAAHQEEWNRLDQLIRRRRKLTGPEADELVALYRRASTHLSTIRSAAPDIATVERLSRLVS